MHLCKVNMIVVQRQLCSSIWVDLLVNVTCSVQMSCSHGNHMVKHVCCVTMTLLNYEVLMNSSLILLNTPLIAAIVKTSGCRILKVPLTCKLFIAEKGSLLPIDKLHGTLSCKQWLRGGEIRGFSCQNLSLCN